MAANDTSGRPPGPSDTGDTGEPDDVGALLDDMDEVLEENAEEIVRSYVQEGGQ
jgi:ubiquitin-like protein Pup